MAKVLVVYATDYNNTKKVAEAIAEGVLSVSGAEVEVKQAENVTIDDLHSSDAVIVGTPVHMGSLDWRIKKFIDTVCSQAWMKNSMNGKVGAVFATGGGYGNAGGGVELTLLSMLSNFAELGMIIVPLPKNTPGYHLGGIQWGPWSRSAGEKMEQTGVSEDKLEVVRHHGANVARVASLLKGKEIFTA
jgi:NAD(P)H dehydrogenase (quinone)